MFGEECRRLWQTKKKKKRESRRDTQARYIESLD